MLVSPGQNSIHQVIDPRFRVQVIRATPNPQQVVYAAMHQCYSSEFVADQNFPSESKSGEVVVKRLLTGDRGHYGCLESPAITFNVGYFPHSVMQQARTHRVGVTFDCQSFRYTSLFFIEVAEEKRNIEDVVYFRPVGEYSDRQGKRYTYSEIDRLADIKIARKLIENYALKITAGFSEEHARGMLPFDIRQHFIVSFNARSLMHFLDLRSKADAQLEIRQLSQLLFAEFQNWMPEIAEWYEKNRLGKARLAP